MRKSILTLVLAAAACLPMAAQDNSIVNNPDNKAYFGIRLGGEITCPGDVTSQGVGISAYKNGGGVELGGIYNMPVVANFYIEPGLKFYYNTYSAKKSIIDAIDSDMSSASVKKFGMRIPVTAGYHFDFTDNTKVYVFTGPELEIGFSAKEKAKSKSGISMSENLYSEDGMKRVNLLWSIGAGISYQRYYFGVSGNLGMLNMIDQDNVSFHESRVSFSLGYNF